MRLASRFGLTHSIRQERPLTNDELVKVVPSVFSEEKHNWGRLRERAKSYAKALANDILR